jgi:hypothetical protein
MRLKAGSGRWYGITRDTLDLLSEYHDHFGYEESLCLPDIVVEMD